MSEGLAGNFFMGHVPDEPATGYTIRRTLLMSAGHKVDLSEDARELAQVGERELRQWIREEVRKALAEALTGPVSETRHVPASGVCWACQHLGTDLEWHGTHVIHATDACRRLAREKPESKEHSDKAYRGEE